jgi:putative membrane protein
VGENPFEGSANDVPISTISRGIEIDLLEMLGTPKENIPKPYPQNFDTQM